MSWASFEVETFTTRLNALAEVFSVRAPSQAALDVWVDSLRDLPASYVLAIVANWARFHSRFPTIAEVRKAAAADMSADIERRAAEENATAPKVSDVWAPDVAVAAAYARWRAARAALPAVDPKAWAYTDCLALRKGKHFSHAKRRYLESTFSGSRAHEPEEKRAGLVEVWRARRACPSFASFLAEVRSEM